MTADRKNIFLIGRRLGDEDQLTEMLAFLWQEEPELLDRWLTALGVPVADPLDVETQFVLPGGKRPDISIRCDSAATLVESKLGAALGDAQVEDYLEYLGSLDGRRTLVLLTKKPELLAPSWQEAARKWGVNLLARRWQDIGDELGAIGEASLGADFIELLIKEGLVKPPAFVEDHWRAWNAGYQVLLRIGSFIDELEPFVKQIDPGLSKSGSPGLTKRWLYRVWRSKQMEIGFGMTASGGEGHGLDDESPAVIAFVGRPGAPLDAAAAAVGTTPSDRDRWSYHPELLEARGLLYGWPCLSRPAASVLTAADFSEQLEQAAEFIAHTVQHFRGRGYLPS